MCLHGNSVGSGKAALAARKLTEPILAFNETAMTMDKIKQS
jgi:hypothetical protein